MRHQPVLGLAVLTGARLHRMPWLGLNAGALAGVVFVHWLIFQSLAVLVLTRFWPSWSGLL
ncbi:vitamin K epoxide reductase family protein [Streptomyces sp. Inha503]|uniref:vitamin K epoxide reductase family protein n=1 Tax=Streptomyces sp. Inha503 TaxID=3383314 RepID=UPI0039A1440F